MMEHDTLNYKKAALVVWVSAVFSALTMMVFGLHQWPLVGGDAFAYWPPIIYGVESGEFLNPVWGHAAIYDPQGVGRLTYHGFFFQWLLRLFGANDYTSIYLWAAVFGATTVFLVTAAVLRAFRQHQRGIKSGTLICLILMPPSTVQLYMGVSSRPESLVALLSAVLGFLLVVKREWSVSKAVLCGMIIAMSGLTSPVAGVLLACLLVLLAAWSVGEMPVRWCAWFIGATAVCSVILFCFVYPYDLVEWINGNLNHARNAVWVTGPLDHIPALFKDAGTFGVVPLMIAVLAVSVSVFRILAEKFPRHVFGLGGLGLVFCGLCWYFGIRQPTRLYNVQDLGPLMLLAIGVWKASRFGRYNSLKSWNAASHLLILGALVMCSLGMFRNAILFGFYLKYGENYTSAARTIELYLNKTADVLDVSCALIQLSSSPKMRGLYLDPTADYCIIAQTYSGLRQPPVIKNYALIEDRFVDHIPKVMGIPIASSPCGYNFAIYKKMSN